MVKKFYVKYQYPSTSVTDYLNKFQEIIDDIESVRSTIRFYSQLIEEEVDLIQSTYTTNKGDTLDKINSRCEEQSKKRYIATAYLMVYDHRHVGHLLDEMEKN